MTRAPRSPNVQLPMRALSLRPHWAHAILYLGKSIENRSFNTPYRGDFLIHASGKLKHAEFEALQTVAEEDGMVPPRRNEVLDGGFIGIVTLTNVIQRSANPWFSGPYGYVLEDPRPIDFQPYKGHLRFFTVHRFG